MGYTDWRDKVKEFQKMDVRNIAGNFFQGLKKQAVSLPVACQCLEQEENDRNY